MRPAAKLPTLLAAALSTLCALPGSAHAALRDHGGPYQLQVLVEGQPARTFDHRGETWILGELGARYTLRVINRSARRVEAVVSVDGRDVIDGKPGDFRARRGYLVPAWGSVDIDGWRLSQREAAAFRFSTVSDSYAARTGAGRDVGVIGVAIFPEREAPRVVVPRYPVYPRRYDDRRYDDRRGDLDDNLGSGRGAPPPSPSSSAPSAGSARAGAGAGAAAEAAPRDKAAAPSLRDSRPGLGTEFGEAVASSVHEVEFTRQSPSSPAVILGARYNDHDGLVALGIVVDPPACAYGWPCDPRESAEPFPTHDRVVDRRYAPPPPGWNR